MQLNSQLLQNNNGHFGLAFKRMSFDACNWFTTKAPFKDSLQRYNRPK